MALDPDYIRSLHPLDLDPEAIADELDRLRSAARDVVPAYNEAMVAKAVAAERERWAIMSRQNYEAFCAMRNEINEAIGDMPSAESALLKGPEFHHEAEQVAESVVKFAATTGLRSKPK